MQEVGMPLDFVSGLATVFCILASWSSLLKIFFSDLPSKTAIQYTHVLV